MKRKRPRSRKIAKAQTHSQFRVDAEPQEGRETQPQPPPAQVSPVPRAPGTAASASAGPGPIAGGQPLRIPTILLEGDEPTPAAVAETGPKYALDPVAGAPELAPGPGDLPQAYGTGRLMLTARDPHCLYAHWDLTSDQQRQYHALSADRHLVLRVYFGQAAGPPMAEQHLPPDARHSFLHVDEAGRPYAVALGYYQADRQWRTIATSETVSTPAESLAKEKTVSFATVPWEPPPPVSRQPAQASASPVTGSTATAAAMPPPPFVTRQSDFETAGSPALAAAEGLFKQDWEEPQSEEERTISLVQAEPVKTLSREDERGIPAQLEFGPTAPALLNVSSPTENVPPGERPFGLSLNAELIIYGATTPDAQVSLGGRRIHLRPDGSFSYRFALPDGKYELAVSAVSPQAELRQAELSFVRSTHYKSEVGVHPQNPALQPPPGPPAHVG